MILTRRLGLAALAALAATAASHAQTPAASWNPAALAEVVSYVKNQNTTGFLIIQNGQTIAEHNWPLPASAEQFRKNFTYGANAKGALLEDVASQQKSFIAILAGAAIDKGLLDISQTVSSYIGEGWSKAPAMTETGITVQHLLEMNSGLTEALELEAAPGAQFFYNTPAYALLKPVLEKATGQPLDRLTHDWLTEPAGMTDTAWRQRPAIFAASGNPTGLVTTPRDIAIMGQLILDGGVAANGTRIISQEQVAAMLQPTTTNPAYGRLWWLNGGASYKLPVATETFEGPLIPAAPADLVAAQGAQDRKLYVSPSRKLIIVRMGQAASDRDFNQQLWLRIMKAAPN